MSKINITKPTGNETLSLLSAFNESGTTYIIFDSEKMGSMGLPIIYISKLTSKLEMIQDENEWQSVKNYLRGIINGTNLNYVKVDTNLQADEAFYKPLSLPQASFDLIKSRYAITEESASTPILTPNKEVTVSDLINEMAPSIANQNSNNALNQSSVAPVMPNNIPLSNTEMSTASVIPGIEKVPTSNAQTNVVPAVSTVSNEMAATQTSSEIVPNQVALSVNTVAPITNDIPVTPTIELSSNTSASHRETFSVEKETFMKACENMFDALIGKYERQLSDLEKREQALLQKEKEIDMKLKNATEHLANAEAREKVANIAHDNAQKVMDISNFMPNNPNNN